MMTFTTNNSPAKAPAAPPAPAASPSTSGADPIRDAVLAKLKEAGIHTDGKTDSALLADYTKLLRDQPAEAQDPAKAQQQAQNAARNEFAGYSINSHFDEKGK